MQWQTNLPLIAILRGITPDDALAHVGAVVDAGFDAIEIPLNSPQWEKSISFVVKAYGGRALIGAGTVLKPEQVDQLAGMGCKLIVTPNIHEKVEAAIKSLNYAPSALARSLKLNQTRTIGMLITASTNPFYSELVRGVERSCFERGYSLVLCNTEGDEQRMNRNLETLMQKRVDGLLLLCTETHQPSREIMERYPSIPTVMMDWSPFDGEGDSDLIQDNSLLGGDLATQHLIDKGFTRIACITGPLDKTPARLRLEGYRAAMKRAGLAIPQGYEITGDFEFGGGFDAMQALLAHQQRPQAVFTGNDAMAVGAYQALYQAGLRIPQDMAVIGYDDIELARYMTPPLTTIHQPKDELGELAIDVLIHRMAQPALQQQRLQLTPVLTVRGSV